MKTYFYSWRIWIRIICQKQNVVQYSCLTWSCTLTSERPKHFNLEWKSYARWQHDVHCIVSLPHLYCRATRAALSVYWLRLDFVIVAHPSRGGLAVQLVTQGVGCLHQDVTNFVVKFNIYYCLFPNTSPNELGLFVGVMHWTLTAVVDQSLSTRIHFSSQVCKHPKNVSW